MDVIAQGFRTTDRRVSTLYPTPPMPDVDVRRPRAVGPGWVVGPDDKFCYEVLDPPMGLGYRGRCGLPAGHDGLHPWEMCEASDELGIYEGFDAECGRKIGHEPPHRFIHEWTS